MAGQILVLDGLDFFVGLFNHLALFFRDDDIVHADSRAEEGGVPKAHLFDSIEHFYGDKRPIKLIDILD